MERSESFSAIVKAMVQVQSELKTVKKDRVNPFAENKYATLDAILEELLPNLSKHEIVLTQAPVFEPAENGSIRIGVETHLMHSSGEWFCYPPFFMQLEKGSKMNMAQSAGSVITYAKRYAISAIFGISTGDDVDGVQPQEPEGKKQQQGNQRRNNQQQSGNQQQNRNTPPPQDPQQNQMPTTNDAIVKYVDQLKKAGVDVQKLYAEIAQKEGMQNVKEVDPLRVLGHIKTYYIALKNQAAKRQNEQQQNTENNTQQESLLEGRTTQPVNWGSK